MRYQHFITQYCLLQIIITLLLFTFSFAQDLETPQLAVCYSPTPEIVQPEVDNSNTIQFNPHDLPIIENNNNNVQLVVADSDIVYSTVQTQRLVLVYFTVRCLLPEDDPTASCPEKWRFSMVPSTRTGSSTWLPSNAIMTVDNFQTFLSLNILQEDQFASTVVFISTLAKTGHTLSFTLSLSYPLSSFTEETQYESTFTFADYSNPSNSATKIVIYDSPSIAKRGQVFMYFYNKYIAATHQGDIDPAFDPKKNHAEFQISAWYNFEILPRPTPPFTNPDILELRLFGTGYFQFKQSLQNTPTTTVCWINSLPVIVELLDDQYINQDTYNTESTQYRYYNQTIRIYATPRYDLQLENLNNTLKEPIIIPAEAKDIDFFDTRFFFEFTCEDRVVYVYNPTESVAQGDFAMAIRLGNTQNWIPTKDSITTNNITYFNDRYFFDVKGIQNQGFNTKTPVELMGLVNYEPTTSTLICKTTLNFHHDWWIFNASYVDVVAGSDGIRFKPDPAHTPDHEKNNAVLLSIMPDLSLYPELDVHQLIETNILKPYVQLYPVISTKVGGPFVYFASVPGLRPYIDNVQRLLNVSYIPPIIHISIIFHLSEVEVFYPNPSCSIIIDSLQVKDEDDDGEISALSYSSSRYYNATEEYSRTNNITMNNNNNNNRHNIKLQQEHKMWESLMKDVLAQQQEQQDNNKNTTTFDLINNENDSFKKYFHNTIMTKPIIQNNNNNKTITPHHQSIRYNINQEMFKPFTIDEIQQHIDSLPIVNLKEEEEQQQQQEKEQNNNNTDIITFGAKPNPWPYRKTALNIVSNSYKTIDFTITNPDNTEWEYFFVSTIIGITRVKVHHAITKPDEDGNFYTTCIINPPFKYDNGTIITTTSAMLTKGLRELQIHVPLQHAISTPVLRIQCKDVDIIDESNLAHLVGPPKEYDSTFTAATLKDIERDLKMNQYHQLIMFYNIFNITEPYEIDNNNNNNIKEKQQEEEHHQIYLRQIAYFSIPPDIKIKKSHTGLIVLILVVIIIIAVIISFPIKRYLETRREKQRLSAVTIQTGAYSDEHTLNEMMFEELDDEYQYDDIDNE